MNVSVANLLAVKLIHAVRPHAGVAIELLDQLVRNVVTLEIGAEHGNEVLAAAHLVAHRVHVRPDAVHGDAVMPRRELAGGRTRL